MMTNNSRRDFIKRTASVSFSMAIGALVLSACKHYGKKPPAIDPSDSLPENAAAKDLCDISTLTDTDLTARKSLGYVDKSPMREKKCRNCKLFIPPGGNKSCGGCSMFKGPILAEGYCTYWVGKNV